MNYPKISIITPSYNQGDFLENTICSVLDQKYPNLEYIIIDGGSTDNSVEIIKKYENHLSYWVSEKDKGQSEAINKGFKRATGDIITWLNSDDQFLPNILHAIAEHFIQNPSVDVLIGNTEYLYYESKRTEFKEVPADNLDERILAGMPFAQPSSIIRKSALDKSGYLDESLHYGMDYDLFARLQLNSNFQYIHKTLSKYLIHQSSKTTLQSIKFADDWCLVFSKILNSIKTESPIYGELKKLGLAKETNSKYIVEKEINKKELELAFQYFLLNQVKFRYQAAQLDIVYKILYYLKVNYSDFFKANNLNSTFLRAKFLSPFLLTSLRKLK